MHKRESQYLKHTNVRASSIGIGLRGYTEEEQTTYGAWTESLRRFAERRELGEPSETALEDALRESAPALYARIQDLQDLDPPASFLSRLRVYFRREKFRRTFRRRLIRILEECMPAAECSW